jgi:hypothetical protein
MNVERSEKDKYIPIRTLPHPSYRKSWSFEVSILAFAAMKIFELT